MASLTPNPAIVFDRALLRTRRTRAAAHFRDHKVLFDETEELLLERMADVKKDFLHLCDLGARTPRIEEACPNAESVIRGHLSEASARQLRSAESFGFDVVLDEEGLPFRERRFDLIVSNLCLHWVNDLPGALVQIRRALLPNGLFLAALIGGHTLLELRTALMEAELELRGGFSPRLSPTLDLPTATSLMQRAGFGLPVVDQETVTVLYPGIFELMRDIRGMGESNAHAGRARKPVPRRLFERAEEIYRKKFGNNTGALPATFDFVFLHGWNEIL